MLTYLITGGAGFIGSHLSERLLELGHHVIVIDDLSSGNLRNIERLEQQPRFEFVNDSAGAEGPLAALVERADIIFHLAATVGVLNIIESSATTIENNINTTATVLDLAVKKKTKVIVASTSEVYGKNSAPPFREDSDLVLGPTLKTRWSYAASKIVDEFLALAYWRERGVPTVVVRFFNTIGPRQVGHYGMVVPRFIEQALCQQNLSVFGDGQQSRCFTYVSDVVHWLQLLATDERAVGGVYNLGNPEEVTITELARKIIAITKSPVEIDYVPYERAYEEGFDDMRRRVPDIRKVTELTGYKPQVDLGESLRRTCDWFIEQRGMIHDSSSPSRSLDIG